MYVILLEATDGTRSIYGPYEELPRAEFVANNYRTVQGIEATVYTLLAKRYGE